MINLSRLRPRLALLGLLACLAACATSRSVIDVDASAAAATSGGAAGSQVATAKPAIFAKITDVSDIRKFELNPRDPSIPSLADAVEIKDPKLTSRAIGRKRNTYGAALGDVMLPEGRTVAELVRGIVAAALEDKGYAVVDPSAAEYARALPVSVEVTQFWAWMSPGFWSLPFRCDWGVSITAPEIVGSTPLALSGRAEHSAQAGFDSEWAQTLTLGVADMRSKLRERIRAPSDLGTAIGDRSQPAPTS